MIKKKVLNVVGSGQESVRLVTIEGSIFEIYTYPLGTERTFDTILRGLLIPKRLASFDLVMTSEYFCSFAISLRLIVSLSRLKHVTLTFNQSRRLLISGLSIIDKLINCIFSRCDMFFVHSQHEMRLFAVLHHLPISKFCFVPWGFDLPTINKDRFEVWDNDYLCMIGRNNRDIESFVRLAEGTAIDAILITSHHQSVPTDLPPNTYVFRDLSMEDCLSCIKHARINLILVKDDLRGAGHITAVAAMMLGVPQVVSDARVLDDYFVDQSNCLKVPLGDPLLLRMAVNRILNDRIFAVALARNGVSYAAEWLTYRATVSRTYEMIDRLLTGQTLNTVDSRWQRDFDALSKSKPFSDQHLQGNTY